jgi:hypothetical protein
MSASNEDQCVQESVTDQAIEVSDEVALKHAQGFLQLLAPATEKFCFRTFDDTKGRNDPALCSKFNGRLKDHVSALRSLNGKGSGVFVVVNEGGQTKNEITRIRAVFADTDGAPLEPLKVLEPHIVVQSSPGNWHVYWFVDDDFPLDRFTLIQEAIAAKFSTDNKVKDLPRVMRLPGFYHGKGKPVRVVLKQISRNHPPYSAEQIIEGLDLVIGKPESCKSTSTDAHINNDLLGTRARHPWNHDEATRLLAYHEPDCSEPEWWCALGAIAEWSKGSEDARQTAESWSRGDMHGKPSEKWEQAAFDMKWEHACKRIGNPGNAAYTKLRETAIANGYSTTAAGVADWLESMNSQFVWIDEDAGIYRVQYRDFIPMEKFHAAHANQTQEVTVGKTTKDIPVSVLWLKNSGRRQCRSIVTRPGEPPITSDNRLNDWAGYTVSAVQGDVEPFKALFTY